MKSNALYKRAYNNCLERFADHAIGQDIGSENELACALGVSRTTVRAILHALRTAGLITPQAPAKTITRLPVPEDYFPLPPPAPLIVPVEEGIMGWILRGDYTPGDALRSMDLARGLGHSLKTVEAQLQRFAHFGLLRAGGNGIWILQEISTEFAADLADLRDIFELRAAQKFIALERKSSLWHRLDDLEAEHRRLLAAPAAPAQSFAGLDERLHRLIHEAAPNSLISSFYTLVAMLFHYHYPWSKTAAREHNLRAITQHLDYIAALKARNLDAVKQACQAHLRSARETLLQSFPRPEPARLEPARQPALAWQNA
jgi:DNA-binding GntR family transcriptional regulator